jgi:hypothetical protein
MSRRKKTGSHDHPNSTRRALMTGGAVGLAAVAGSALGRVQPTSAATTTPSVTDWINVTYPPYNADPTGAADSTSGIKSAIAAAAALPTGGVVYLPAGTYKVSAPLELTTGVFLMGDSPAWPAGGTIPTDLAGTIVKPTSGFSNPDGVNQPGVIHVNGDNTTLYRMGVGNLWIDAGNCAAGIHAFSAWGGCFHGSLMNFGVRNAAQDGLHFQEDSHGNRADGWSIRDCMVEVWNNNPATSTTTPTPVGVYWDGQDTQFINVHVQHLNTTTTDSGCWWIANGNNCLWVACRGDQGVYGWVFDSNPGAPKGVLDLPGSTMRLVACGTENNYHQALWLKNSNNTQSRTPVTCSACSFDFPGRDGASTTAAILVTGYNILNLYDCNVTAGGQGRLMATSPPWIGNYPQVGLATAPAGAGVPALVNIDGGFWNVWGSTMISDAAPAALMRYRFYGVAAGPALGGTPPAALTLFRSPTWP